MSAYRLLHWITREYPIAVFWLYVAAFLLAFSMIFVFPPATIVLLWLGLVGLVFVTLIAKLLGLGDRWLARHILDGGGCPECGDRMQTRRDPAYPWACEACGTHFLASGAQAVADTGAG
jgi:hypothetical protein